MRFLFLLLMAASMARAGTRAHEPMASKRLPVVPREATERASKLLRELPSLAPAAAGERLAELLSGHELPRDEAGPWFDLIARAGGPAELQQIYIGLVTGLADDCCEGPPGADFDTGLAFTADEMQTRAIKALIEAAEKRHVLPSSPYLDGRLHFGRHMYFSGPDGSAGDLARLAALLRVTEDYPTLVDLLSRSDDHRAAFDALLLLEPDVAAAAVESACLELDDPLAAGGALLILARTAPERALRFAGRILSMAMDPVALAHLWDQLLTTEGFREALLETLPAYLPPRVLAAGESAAQRVGAKELAEKLHGTASRGAADFRSLAEDAASHGDAVQGEMVFRDANGMCSDCHALGGIGPTRGPDLAKLATTRSAAEIVAAVLQPSAHVTRRYEMVASDEREVTVHAGTGEPSAPRKFTRRPPAEWGASTEPPVAAGPGAFSGMPTGLTDDFTLQELRNLLAFLLHLGTPGGRDAANPHVARQWRIESESTTHPGDFINRRQPTGGTSEVTALIDGRLLKKDSLDALVDSTSRPFYLGIYFDVPVAGKVHLTLEGVAEAWVDGHPIKEPGETVRVLERGEHCLDIRLDPKAMPRFLRVASPDATFSKAPLYSGRD